MKQNLTYIQGSKLTWKKDVEPRIGQCSVRTRSAVTKSIKRLSYNVSCRQLAGRNGAETFYENVGFMNYSFIENEGIFSQSALDLLSADGQVVAHRKTEDKDIHVLQMSSDKKGMKTIHVNTQQRTLSLIIKGQNVPLQHQAQADNDRELFKSILLAADLAVCKSGISANCHKIMSCFAKETQNCVRCVDVHRKRRTSGIEKERAAAVRGYREQLEQCGRTASQGKRFAQYVDLQIVRSQKSRNSKIEPE